MSCFTDHDIYHNLLFYVFSDQKKKRSDKLCYQFLMWNIVWGTEFFKHVTRIASEILICKASNTVTFKNTILSKNFIWKIHSWTFIFVSNRLHQGYTKLQRQPIYLWCTCVVFIFWLPCNLKKLEKEKIIFTECDCW